MESRMTLLRPNSFDWNDSGLVNRCDFQFWICCFSWTVGLPLVHPSAIDTSLKIAQLSLLRWFPFSFLRMTYLIFSKMHYLVSPVQVVHRTFIPLLFFRAKQGCGILWVRMTSLFLMIWVTSRLESIDVLILYRQFKKLSVIYDLVFYFSSIFSSGHSNGWTASKRKNLVNKTCGRKVLNFCHVG